ncbi:alkyl hydroperoxide reductase [Hymenobacter amundsenii]|uniref:Alkyl hydroperoxide reductase n=1 Tax=Hymenobacter amundsenii TaxID=2006685 RepID=A0A2D0AFV4_9BACT|nr:TlpA disulfide reductase family protein [Hymenobacter amundsenii]OWP63211.1 alkyl hydroperoxide reductase [Hymenobacter amundsenii]
MHRFSLLPALLLAGTSLAQAQYLTSFTLKGQLGLLQGPAKVYLRREGLFQGQITDSATVKNGTFVLRGITDGPVRGRLVLVRPGQYRRLLTGQADNCAIYLEKGTISVSSPDSLAHATVGGTPLNTEYQQLRQQLAPVQAPMEALRQEYYATPPDRRAATGILPRLEAQQNITEPAELALRTSFIKAHPASLVSLDAVQDVGGPIPSYAVVGPLFEGLDAHLKATAQGQALGRQVAALQRVAVGAPAPAFTLPDPTGKAFTLADFRGKFVLVDFWASWCGPCRRDNPNLIQYYNQFKGRNFEVVGISLDDAPDRAKWLKAVQDDHLPWLQLWTPGGWQQGVALLYNVRAIPRTSCLTPTASSSPPTCTGRSSKQPWPRCSSNPVADDSMAHLASVERHGLLRILLLASTGGRVQRVPDLFLLMTRVLRLC